MSNTLLKLAATAGIILVYRWTLHLSSPKDDWRLFSLYMYELARVVKRRLNMLRVWLVSLVRFVPTKQVEQAWTILRDNLAAGRYGEAGT